MPLLLLPALMTMSLPARADESMDKAFSSWEAGNYQEALEIWLLKAYEGNAEAQYRLGRMFADGTGTVVDHSEAVYWFTRSTEQGYADAQYELGNAYFHGSGIAPDKAKAIEWWHVAAENGSAEAQYHLGRAYFYGIELEQDTASARQWFEQAAAQEHQLATAFLARLKAREGSGEVWKGYGRVGDRGIWVYSSFNRLSPILRELPAGALLRVIENRGGWFRVQIPGGVPVWVASDRVVETEGGHMISGSGVQARPDPSNNPDTKAVGIFLDGDGVTLIERKESWAQVQAPESITGWVEAIDVDELPEAQRVAEEWLLSRNEVLATLPADGRVKVALSAPAGDSGGGAAVDQAENQAQASTTSDPVEGEPISAEQVSAESEQVQAGSGEADADKSVAAADTVQPGAGLPQVEISTDDPRFSLAASERDVRSGNVLRVGPQGLDIFARNRLDSALIERLPPALLVRVIAREGNWARVEVPGGLPLWIYSRFLKIDDEEGVITGRGVRARPLPSTSNASQPVGNYPTGASVRIIEQSGEWVRIRAPESLSAWIQIDHLFVTGTDEAEWRQQGESGPMGSASTVSETGAETESGGVEEVTEPESVAAGGTEQQDEETGSALQAETAGLDEIQQGAEPAADDVSEQSAEGEEIIAPVAEPAAEPSELTESETQVEAEEDEVAETRETSSEVEAAEETGDVASTEAEQPGAEKVEITEEPGSDVAGSDQVEVAAESVDSSAESMPEGGGETEIESVGKDSDANQPAAIEGNDAVIQQTGEEVSGEAPAETVADSVESTTETAPAGDGQADPVGKDSDANQPAAVVDSDQSVQTELKEADDEAPVVDVESVAVDEKPSEPVVAEDAQASGETPETVADEVEEASPAEVAAAGDQVRQAEEEVTRVESASAGDMHLFDDLEWLYRQSGEAFSIEVLRDAGKEAVEAAVASIQADLPRKAFSARTDSGLQYSLMVGSFPVLRDVQQALSAIPPSFDSIRIRRLDAVQKEWCSKLDNLTPEQLLVVLDKCSAQ